MHIWHVPTTELHHPLLGFLPMEAQAVDGGVPNLHKEGQRELSMKATVIDHCPPGHRFEGSRAEVIESLKGSGVEIAWNEPREKGGEPQKAVSGVDGGQEHALDVLTESRVKPRVAWAARIGGCSLRMCSSRVVETL